MATKDSGKQLALVSDEGVCVQCWSERCGVGGVVGGTVNLAAVVEVWNEAPGVQRCKLIYIQGSVVVRICACSKGMEQKKK